MPIGPPVVGETTDGAFDLGPPGGSRTTGLEESIKPFRDMMEPAGETRLSRPISRAMDERLLMATLGEYTLPPYALVGRSARGIKMNDRSVVGNIYRGGAGGSEMRTGLSRRRGGRWFGRRVCCLMGTFWNTIGAFI
jgi:hypothetical protein